MIKAHQKKVYPYYFRVGDLVLKMIQPPQKDHRGKLIPIRDLCGEESIL